MTKQQDTLKQIRARIDSIDQQIQQLINDRAMCAIDVAKTKQQENKANNDEASASGEVNYYRPEREAEVLRQVINRNKGPLPSEGVAHIFRELMSACLALEQPIRAAYFGPEGTYTQAATLKHFGHSVITQPAATIDGVFAQVEAGEARYGVVPVENSTEGMITHTLDNFMQTPLQICGEVELRIHHHLLIKDGDSLENAKAICAHSQSLAQCRHWLDEHWPKMERIAVSSNGEAAKMAAEGNGVLAIAGDLAAEKYRLTKAANNIEDLSNNTTRFLIIGKESVAPGSKDKTSIIISTRNAPGALYKLLEPFYREGVSLTRIESRPSRTETWAYVFFVEFEGHQEDKKICGILTELEEHSVVLKILGSYPQAVL